MIRKVREFTVFCSVVFVLAACGGDSGSGSGGETTSLSDIAGLWDLTYEDQGRIDEIYWGFSASGSFTIYDYFGDSFDNGDNCYFILEDIAEIVHLGGNSFEIRFGEGIDDILLDASRSGSDLIVEVDGVERRLSPSVISVEAMRSMECEDDAIQFQAKPSVSNADIIAKLRRLL